MYKRHGKLAYEYCKVRLELCVMQSNAGYYLGTWDEEGPVSRESEYFGSKAAAEYALENNTFCQRDMP